LIEMPRGRERNSSPLHGDAFAALYREHSEALLVFFARRVYEPELAFDLTAETFAQALLDRRKFRGESQADAVAWIYGIAKHQLSRYFRKGAAEGRALAKLGVERPAFTDAELEHLERVAGLAELRSSMAEALAKLSQQQRQALQLRVVDELDYPEVARRLGITEQNARARVSRGLRALGRHFEGNPLPEEAI
jgi:RNA polymerase sigma factor (sigma-70 family)